MIKLKTLKWRNFLSYGNNETSFDFTKGVSYISGENGSGKSCLKDALSFCLFGVGYRNINKENLFNEINKEKLWTEVSFSIGSSEYKVVRGLKPDILEIWKNGVLQDYDSSNRLVQNNINDLLKFDWNFFKRTIALSSNNKSFFRMSDKERNDFFEKFFDIEILNRMDKKNKTEFIDYSAKDSMIARELEMIEKSLSEHKQTLTKLETLIKEANENVKEKKEKKNKEVEQLKNELKIKLSEYKEQNEEFVRQDNTDELKVEKENLEKEANELNKVKTTWNVEYTKLENALENLDKHGLDLCPFCAQDITEDKIELFRQRKKQAGDIIDEINEKKKNLNLKYSSVKTSMEALKRRRELLLELKRECVADKQKLDYTIKNLEEENTSNNNEALKENIIQIIQNIIQNKEVKMKEREENMDKLNVAETIKLILSKGSFSKFFYSKFTPLLQKKYNENLACLDFKGAEIKCAISNDLSVQFQNNNKPRDFESFSEGEMKRLDSIFYLSLFETSYMVSKNACDVMIMDEFIDGGLDEVGVEDVLKLIKGFSKDKSIVLISHKIKEELHGYFDRIFRVTKHKFYSEISEEKNG